MDEKEKEEIIDKWKESGLFDDCDFDSDLFPTHNGVAATTISQDLIFASDDEINEVKQKVKSENREGKIDAVIENKEFKEKNLEDDEEYKELIKKGVTPMSAPSSQLMYIDFKYEGTDIINNIP